MKKVIEIKKALAESIFGLFKSNLIDENNNNVELYSDVDLNSFELDKIYKSNVFQINSDGNFINPENGIYKSIRTEYEIEIIDGKIIEIYI